MEATQSITFENKTICILIFMTKTEKFTAFLLKNDVNRSTQTKLSWVALLFRNQISQEGLDEHNSFVIDVVKNIRTVATSDKVGHGFAEGLGC